MLSAAAWGRPRGIVKGGENQLLHSRSSYPLQKKQETCRARNKTSHAIRQAKEAHVFSLQRKTAGTTTLGLIERQALPTRPVLTKTFKKQSLETFIIKAIDARKKFILVQELFRINTKLYKWYFMTPVTEMTADPSNGRLKVSVHANLSENFNNLMPVVFSLS